MGMTKQRDRFVSIATHAKFYNSATGKFLKIVKFCSLLRIVTLSEELQRSQNNIASHDFLLPFAVKDGIPFAWNKRLARVNFIWGHCPYFRTWCASFSSTYGF